MYNKIFVPYHIASRMQDLGFGDICVAKWMQLNEIRVPNWTVEDVVINEGSPIELVLNHEPCNDGQFLCLAPTWCQAWEFAKDNEELKIMLYATYGKS